MKTLKPILIVFSLLISLPFVSKGQNVDSASVLKAKTDSIIIANRIRFELADANNIFFKSGKEIHNYK